MKTNQSTSGLNRGLSLIFWWLRSTNHVEITEQCVMCQKKHVLVKKIFINGLNIGSLQRVENKVHGVEIHRLSDKKVPNEAVSKEGHADNFLGHKKPHDY